MVTFVQRRKKALLIAFILLLVAIGGAVIYVSQFYHAGEQAQLALQSDEAVTVSTQADGSVIFTSELAHRGLIFYPGGKVEHTAYAPLMHSLAEQGWHCVLVKMPLHLAVLDPYAAAGIPEQFPEVDSWYIGGHSLGGAMAANYAAKHAEDFDGLILLASYSTEDLRQSGLDTYTLYGSEDGVLNLENYREYSRNLPEDVHELMIDGGCHAYFGDYGAQDGDGEPAISAMEQIRLTVDFLSPSA